MTFGSEVKSVVELLDAPNYFYWSILPFLILVIAGYIIGFPYFRADFEAGGYNTYEKTRECNDNANADCTDIFKDKLVTKEDYDRCVDDYMNNSSQHPECESVITGKTGKWVVLAVYIIVPIIVASILTSLIYHTVLYIKNPRIAAASAIWNMVRPATSGSSAAGYMHNTRKTSYAKPGYYKYRR